MRPHVVTWPRLHQMETMEFPVVALIWSVGCALVGPAFKMRSWWTFLIACLPFGLVLLVDLVNEVKRLLWARSFGRMSTLRKLRPELRACPERYQYHSHGYGGFDRMKLRPAVIVHDQVAGQRIAIYPGFGRVIPELRRLGIRECAQPQGASTEVSPTA